MWGTIRVLFAMATTAAVVVINSTISTWATEVDLLLALAADVSRSVDQQKFNLHRKRIRRRNHQSAGDRGNPFRPAWPHRGLLH